MLQRLLKQRRGRFSTYIIGFGLLFLAVLMLGFSLYAFLDNENYQAFLWTALLGLAIGSILVKLGNVKHDPTRREALIGVLLLWLLVPIIGALPYYFSGKLSLLNAIFESMSGFTTTGATVIRDFSSFSPSYFMWRALTQWIGGVGIIVLFIAVFPQLAIAGRQLFFAEAPGPTEDRLTPRLRHTSNAVLIVYVLLTVLCILAYVIGGMSFYDALAHAFTTLAAGGFSPNPVSFQGYSPLLNWICIIFMFLAGANFALQYRALMGQPKQLFGNLEFRAYSMITLGAGLILCYSLMVSMDHSPLEALRHALFQV
ncbi:MAG: potassium transporter TrkG, partial [Deinococcales bacterium]